MHLEWDEIRPAFEKIFSGRFLTATLAALIFLGSAIFFVDDIDFPGKLVSDEVYYVSAARQFNHREVNENWSHPPLGKMLIGLGMRMTDDNPFGWRIMSAIFGSLALVFLYFWALVLFQSQGAALTATAIALLNQLHYVQSRLATLDVFMMTFMLLGLWLFSAAYFERLPSRQSRYVCYGLALVAFGLAGACKWFGFLPLAVCVPLLILRTENGERPPLSVVAKRASVFALPVLVVYFAVNVFLLGLRNPTYGAEIGGSNPANAVVHYGVWDIVQLQVEMFKAQFSADRSYHPFQSAWYSWPLEVRPFWHYRDSEIVVACLGNPFILWTGFLAILWGLRQIYRKEASAELRLMIGIYLLLWICWAFIRSGSGFFFYYYPAAMVMSLAIVAAIRSFANPKAVGAAYLAVSLVVFAFFFPILTGIPIDKAAFERRMLFDSWSAVHPPDHNVNLPKMPKPSR